MEEDLFNWQKEVINRIKQLEQKENKGIIKMDGTFTDSFNKEIQLALKGYSAEIIPKNIFAKIFRRFIKSEIRYSKQTLCGSLPKVKFVNSGFKDKKNG